MYSSHTPASHRSIRCSLTQARLSFVHSVLPTFNHVRIHVPSLDASRAPRYTSVAASSASSSFTQSFRPTVRRPRASRLPLWRSPLPTFVCPTCSSQLNDSELTTAADLVSKESRLESSSGDGLKSEPLSLKRLPVRALLAVAAVGAVAYVIKSADLSSVSAAIDYVTSKARTLGPLRAAALLCCLNFTTVLFCFPANMGLMIAAGAILPAPYAFAALFLSKLLAACAAFLLGRTFLRSRAERWLGNYPRLQKVLARPEVTRWTFVVLLRLSPFPGFVLNYLLSLTAVPFGQYALGTVFGIAPSIANLVLIGDAAKGVGQTVAAGATLSAWLAPALKLAMVSSMFFVTLHVTKLVSAAFDEQAASEAYEGNGGSHHANGKSRANGFEKKSLIHVPASVHGTPFDSDGAPTYAEDHPVGVTVENDTQPVTRRRRSSWDENGHYP